MLCEVCDVFGTSKELKRYRVLVESYPIDAAQQTVEAERATIVTEEHDAGYVLCPRAFERFMKKVRSGLAPPVSKKTTDTDALEPAGATKA